MIELPTERRPIQNYNPKLLVLFGKPKSGKSTLMASLDDNLIIDLEDGYRALSVMAVVAKTSQQLFEVRDALREKMGSQIIKSLISISLLTMPQDLRKWH